MGPPQPAACAHLPYRHPLAAISTTVKTIKLTFLFILSLIKPVACVSQNWLPIGSEWTYTNSVFGQITGTNSFIITDTTSLLGQKVVTLKRRDTTCDLRPQIEYLYKNSDSLFYFENEVNEFRLLYDFGAQVGESYTIPLWQGIGNDSLWVKVDSIGKFNIGVKELRKYYVRYGYTGVPNSKSGPFDDDYVIIEDIGSLVNLFHMFENGWCDWIHNSELRCFIHPQFGTESFTTDRCSIPVSTPDLHVANSEVKAYPNPVSNTLTLEIIGNLPSRISLFTSHGLMVRTWESEDYEHSSQNIQISLKDLNDGLYLIQIENLFNKRIQYLKVIKV